MEQVLKMLNEGFMRKYLKESEDMDMEEEKDEIEVGDLFTNGDETYELLDVKIDENGDVVVEAENKESGEPEDIEYISKEEAEEMYGEYNPEEEPEEEELTDLTVECINKRKFMEKFSSLRNLNEAQMSDEDRADSEILRKILINKYRPSDRLNKKELAVLDKYGLTRDINRGQTYVHDADGNILGSNVQYYKNSKIGIDDRVNLADRARKMSSRNDHSDNDYDYYTWGGYAGQNRARYNDIKNDRLVQNYKLQKNYNQMKNSLNHRNRIKDYLDSVDHYYDDEEARLRKQLDALNKQRENSKNPHLSRLNDEQSKIDKLLRRKKGTATVATESISDNATKAEFIKAYKWAYGATNAEAQKAFKEFDEKAKQEIIKGFKQNAKKSFLSDGLHRSNSKARRLKESADNLWYGIPGIKFIWINSTADPLIEYKGKKLNSHIVEDTMWERFREDGGDDQDFDAFEEYMRDNADDVYELCELALNPEYYAESIRRNSKKIRGLKEARNSSRKRVTQKYLKDLIKSGKAENLNTWTDSQLNELQKKNYETVAVSFGINGMNGILLKDSDGKLYAVPSRSTTMFQMHKL